MFNSIIKIPRKIVMLVISLYQATVSPDHGIFAARYPHGYCRHYPSCSQYTKEAVGRFGVLKGLFLGSKRILKCNPWVEPKIDLIPKLT